MLEQLRSATAIQVGIAFTALNLVVFGASILLCWGLGMAFRGKRIFDRWEPIRSVEVAAALGTVVLNAGVSVAGWWLWIHDAITIQPTELGPSTFDCLVMILAMDFGMYFTHRIAHVPWVFELFHRFHHRHEATNPISLFVLHPFEVLGFGGMMILFLVLYPMTLGGLIAYLTLNVLFGTLGHSGVEPFPSNLQSIPVLRWLGTSTFHAEHHEHTAYNFGFYTLIWDRLFGTLDPGYTARFGRQS